MNITFDDVNISISSFKCCLCTCLFLSMTVMYFHNSCNVQIPDVLSKHSLAQDLHNVFAAIVVKMFQKKNRL